MPENVNRKIKIQFITRGFPLAYYFGSCIYLQDFVGYLQQLGFKIELVSLNAPTTARGIFIIPSAFKKLSFSVKDNIRIGRFLLQSRAGLAWITILPWLIYNLLPNSFQRIIQSINKSVKQRLLQRKSETVNTGKKAQIQVEQDVFPTPEEIAFAKEQFVRFQPDVVIANYTCLANLLDAIPDEAALKVILNHDIQHQRVTSFQQAGVDLDRSNWNWDLESAQLQKAQVLLAIQQEDARVLKEMAPNCEVIYMPMSGISHSHTVNQVPGRCLFVGSRSPHNVHGLEWFLENVWSSVVRSVPTCSLHICGNICTQIQGAFPNVDLLGEVDNLEPEYSAAEVCLVPLLAGSGLKIKLVEAMSYGRACVSTSVGVQGVPEIAGKTTLVADTAEDFAAAVRTLLTNADKRQWMEEQARKYVTEKLSPQAAYQPFVDRIKQHLQQVANKNNKQSLDNSLSSNKVLTSNLMPNKEKSHEI